MKKLSFALTVIFSLFTLNLAQASPVSKAKDFMKAGMYNQAIAVLEKEINDKPANAEAHFELGNCYAVTYQMHAAEQRFKSAVMLKPDYGYKVAGKFKDAGKLAVNNGMVKEALVAYGKAIEYQPNIRAPLVKELFQEGEILLRTGILGAEKPKLLLAAAFDDKTRKTICQLYSDLADRASDEDSLYLYNEAATVYCNNYYNKPGGDRLTSIAKKLAAIPGRENEAKAYREVAIKLIGETQVKSTIEETKIYYAGTYHFSLKAGEQTDHWIAPDPNKKTLSSYTSHDEKNFRIIFSDGDSYPGNASVPLKNYPKYKFVAITDQPDIVLSIK